MANHFRPKAPSSPFHGEMAPTEEMLFQEPVTGADKKDDGSKQSHNSETETHIGELDRNFSLLSICSVGIVTGDTWAALGGSIAVALGNGGSSGVIYEFMCVTFIYCFIAASLAELASSMPSSAGVYHWASVTGGPKYGRICGWFAGFWNYLCWNLACGSMSAIASQICVEMYALNHPEYVYQAWHVFIGYLIVTWGCCAIVLFANRYLPSLNNIGLFFILGGVLVTILVCAIMPSRTGKGYASTSSVWAGWTNETGYTSNGFVFCAGMLNGAFAIGTPDCVSHLAEEIPQPKRNVPLAIVAQLTIGFVTGFIFLVVLFYGAPNPDMSAPVFPLASIYYQITGSAAGSIGLLFMVLVPALLSCIGDYITAGRTLWTLAREDATPFPGLLGKISTTHKNPFNATLFCGVVSTLLGFIYLGSSTAFNAFVSSFILLSTLSYLATIVPFIFTGRFSRAHDGNRNGMAPGPFKMGPLVGYAVNIISCLYMIAFNVIYCFPYTAEVTAANMNYTCLITGGLTIIITVWWLFKRRSYKGPAVRF